MVEVPTLSLDSLNLARIDPIKIDVEGMKMDTFGRRSPLHRRSASDPVDLRP